MLSPFKLKWKFENLICNSKNMFVFRVRNSNKYLLSEIVLQGHFLPFARTVFQNYIIKCIILFSCQTLKLNQLLHSEYQSDVISLNKSPLYTAKAGQKRLFIYKAAQYLLILKLKTNESVNVFTGITFTRWTSRRPTQRRSSSVR